MATDYNRAYKAEYKGTTTGGAYKTNNKTRSSRAYKVVVGGPRASTVFWSLISWESLARSTPVFPDTG